MKDYHINVFYSQEDEGYIAEIPDLKHCSAFGKTPQEALQEVPKLYQSQLKAPPSPPLSFSSFNEFNSNNDPQQIIEAQKIQIQFLEKANFNNIFHNNIYWMNYWIVIIFEIL